VPVSTATSREQIFSALFALLGTATFASPIAGKTTWGGSARKYVDPAQLPMEQMPFLSQWEGPNERYERPGNRLVPVRTLACRVNCWARVDSGDPAELGTTYLTLMMEAIEAAMAPDTAGYGSPNLLTLGGLVQWCRIEGTVLKFTGDTDQQAMVSVPIRILWP
jgi:hypothetical protein